MKDLKKKKKKNISQLRFYFPIGFFLDAASRVNKRALSMECTFCGILPKYSTSNLNGIVDLNISSSGR